MCDGYDCERKERCYRYTAIPYLYGQSYFLGKPTTRKKCEYFIHDTKKNRAHFPEV